MDLQDSIRQFVITNFYVADAAALKNEQSLLDAGIVDSTGVLEIISFVEREFSITVADAEMLPENLDSVTNIARFVARKRGS